MPTRNFIVPLRDLDDGPRTVRFELDDGFLRDALEGTDASWDAPGSVELEVAKVGAQIMVRGKAQLDVSVPCARTLVPVPLALRPDIFLMLTKTSGTAAGTKSPRKRRRAEAAGEQKKRPYQPWVDDPELGDSDASFDTFEGEELVLDGFVREFLVLELPMVTVASDLPTDVNAGIPRPPAESGEKPVDPRLAPLAAIAARLRKDD